MAEPIRTAHGEPVSGEHNGVRWMAVLEELRADPQRQAAGDQRRLLRWTVDIEHDGVAVAGISEGSSPDETLHMLNAAIASWIDNMPPRRD